MKQLLTLFFLALAACPIFLFSKQKNEKAEYYTIIKRDGVIPTEDITSIINDFFEQNIGAQFNPNENDIMRNWKWIGKPSSEFQSHALKRIRSFSHFVEMRDQCDGLSVEFRFLMFKKHPEYNNETFIVKIISYRIIVVDGIISRIYPLTQQIGGLSSEAPKNPKEKKQP